MEELGKNKDITRIICFILYGAFLSSPQQTALSVFYHTQLFYSIITIFLLYFSSYCLFQSANGTFQGLRLSDLLQQIQHFRKQHITFVCNKQFIKLILHINTRLCIRAISIKSFNCLVQCQKNLICVHQPSAFSKFSKLTRFFAAAFYAIWMQRLSALALSLDPVTAK